MAIWRTLAADLRFILDFLTRFDVEEADSFIMVGAVHFVAVRAAIMKTLAPYVRIIEIFDVGGTIHQTHMYRLLESYLVQNGVRVR